MRRWQKKVVGNAMCLVWMAGMAAAQVAAPPPVTITQDDLATRSVTMSSKVFHRLLAFQAPGVFRNLVTEHTNENFYIREVVAPGETSDHWTQMITVTGASGLAQKAGLTPLRMSQSMAAGYKKACPDSYASKSIGTLTVAGRPAFLALVGCGDVEDYKGKPGERHSETALILVVAGEEDYYTLQWAERGAATATLAFDEALWQGRFKSLNPIRICPILPDEKAPYPSCVGK